MFCATLSRFGRHLRLIVLYQPADSYANRAKNEVLANVFRKKVGVAEWFFVNIIVTRSIWDLQNRQAGRGPYGAGACRFL
jgi:hypothetical protein